jgi:hypothetical protein
VVDLAPHRRRKQSVVVPDPALRGAHFHGDPCAPVATEDWPEAQR